MLFRIVILYLLIYNSIFYCTPGTRRLHYIQFTSKIDIVVYINIKRVIYYIILENVTTHFRKQKTLFNGESILIIDDGFLFAL